MDRTFISVRIRCLACVAVMKYQLEHSKVFLTHVHDESRCAGSSCTIHNRSQHHLRGWPQVWRDDRKIMERMSPFGCNCPDPDSPWDSDSYEWVHGCIIGPLGRPVCEPFYHDGISCAWISTDMFVTGDGRVWYVFKGQMERLHQRHIRVGKLVLTQEQWAWRAWNG